MTTQTQERVEFLPLVETLRAQEASLDRLYGGEGRRVRINESAPYLRKLKSFTDLMREAYEGSARAQYVFKEALTTSDFPNLYGDVIQRQLLGTYAEIQPTYQNYVRVVENIPDFRTVKRIALNGSEAVLSAVPELSEYPIASLADAVYSYAVSKFGRRLDFSWESIVNDDLGAFSNPPIGDRLARAARRSEEKFATQLFVDANGPHASLYTVGNKNIINTTNGASATNPALTIAAFQDAMTVLSKMVDADGEPIFVDTVQLVVPPALAVVAQNIINATQLILGGLGQTGGGGVAAQQVQVANWMRNNVQINVNYYIPTVAASANGNTSWFLFATPTTGRPALEMGFLRGYRAPQMFRKDSDAVALGGGAAGPETGDFDTDSLGYKIRHVFGGTRLDPKATVASNGSGS